MSGREAILRSMPLATHFGLVPAVIAGSLGAMYGLALDLVGGAWSARHSADCPAADRSIWYAARWRRPLVVASACAISIDSLRRLPMPGVLLNAVLLPMLIVLALIDLVHRRLPNAFVYPLAGLTFAIVLLASLVGGNLDVASAIGASLLYGGGLYALARLSKGGVGMGDVKVAGIIGWTLGATDWRAAAVAVVATVVCGGIVGVVALAMGRGRRSLIPYGPVLAAGAIVGGMWWPMVTAMQPQAGS